MVSFWQTINKENHPALGFNEYLRMEDWNCLLMTSVITEVFPLAFSYIQI